MAESDVVILDLDELYNSTEALGESTTDPETQQERGDNPKSAVTFAPVDRDTASTEKRDWRRAPVKRQRRTLRFQSRSERRVSRRSSAFVLATPTCQMSLWTLLLVNFVILVLLSTSTVVIIVGVMGHDAVDLATQSSCTKTMTNLSETFANSCDAQSLALLETAIQAAEDMSAANARTARSKLRDAIIIACAASILWVLLGLIVFRYVAGMTAEPLKELQSNMERMSQLEFEEVRFKKQSKIVEIRETQRIFQKVAKSFQSFCKFVPEAAASRIMAGDHDATALVVRRTWATIMFTDIANFTGIAELLSLNQLVTLTSTYLEDMTKIIRKHGGTIIDFIGDGMMIFWSGPDHAAKSLQCAIEMRNGLKKLNADNSRLQNDLPELSQRVGIHTGRVVVGNLGSESKLKYGVLGDTVNLASRIENLNKRYQTDILVTSSTFHEDGVREGFTCRPVDRVAVKGRSRATELYHVLNNNQDTTEADTELQEATQGIFKLYVQGSFGEAEEAIAAWHAAHPADGPLASLARSCQDLRDRPETSAWKGVTVLNQK